MALPDGYYLDGMVFWGRSLSRATVLAKGLFVEIEDMRTASAATLNEWDRRLKNVLGMLGDSMALQIQWSVDGDYRDILDAYARGIDERCDTSEWTGRWCSFVRRERFLRYLASPNLRRERLTFWITKHCDSLPKRGKRTIEQVDSFLAQQARSFSQVVAQISDALGDMASVRPMTDFDHFLAHRRCLAPSTQDLPDADKLCEEVFDPESSVLENCLCSDGIMTRDADGNVCFQLDGYYHTILVMRRWPQQAYQGIMRILTDLAGRCYCITQNVYPKDIKTEIAKAEHDAQRLSNEGARNNKVSKLEHAKLKNEKAVALARGSTLPFEALTVVRVWAKTLPELNARALSVKAAINSMSGAQCYQVQHETQAKNIFCETIPGWTGGASRGWDIYAESTYLSMLLPASNSSCGRWQDGEIIFDGANDNLVGVQTFVNGTPQNAVFLGSSGSGKSVTLCDIISQNACFVDYTVIIEEGLSYATIVQAMGGRTIIITPDCGYCFNYFDTQGLPLSAEHVSVATSLCMIFIGDSGDREKDQRRHATIGEYIQQVYDDCWEAYRRSDDERYMDIVREAMIVDRYRRESLGAGATLLDAYMDIKELRARDADAYAHMVSELGDDDAVVSFARDVKTRKIVRDIGFTHFKPSEFPTHSTLVEAMRYAPMQHHEKQEVLNMAVQLKQWGAEGSAAGGLFDGVSSIDLYAPVVHFELGRISDSNATLKQAAGFIIANYVRQHIVAMPRAKRKQMIIEEVVRFLDVTGGEKVVEELYGQLRKYACWVLCVTQQYRKLRDSKIKPIIFGNTKMAFLAKQRDVEDLADVAQVLKLSNSAQQAIANFEMPEHQSGRKHSDIVVTIEDRGRPMSYIARNFAADAMIYAARSDGAIFDERAKALTKYPNVFEGILAETELAHQATRQKAHGHAMLTR